MTYQSNRAAVEAKLDKQKQRAILNIVTQYKRFMADMQRQPKTGRVYGAEEEITFKAKVGGERQVEWFVNKDGGKKRFGSKISFTANKGKKAKKKRISFVVNKGKKLGGKGWRGHGVHQASAPGEAPANQTGALLKGVTHTLTKSGEDWTAQVGVSIQSGRGAPTGSNNKSIAEDLEFGTSKMKPRPMWRPALEMLRQHIANGYK